jgi:hypothetical protein
MKGFIKKMFLLKSRGPAISLILLGVLCFSVVSAEHEPNHRFTIMGEVVDVNGNPVPGVEVTATDTRIGLSEVGVTDGSGRYSIQLHLHDENLGDVLTISARGVIYEDKVAFSPQDLRTERIMVLNLKGDTWSLGEKSEKGGSNLPSIIILIAIVVILYLGVKSPGKGSKKAAEPQKKKRKKRKRR